MRGLRVARWALLAAVAGTIGMVPGRAATAPAAGLSAGVTRLNDIAQEYLGLPDLFRAAAVARAYDATFAPYFKSSSRLGQLSAAKLADLFKATQLVHFYAWRGSDVRHLTMVLDLLEKRGMATRDERLQTYHALVAARRFKQANALAAAHPALALQPLPEVVDQTKPGEKGPEVLAASPAKRELIRRRIDLERPALIVVIVSPLCHFAANGARAIFADPKLARVFRDHAVWLAPPDGYLYFQEFQTWNRAHPGAQIALAMAHRDWPMVDSWDLPTFYFLQNGSKVAEVSGWPAGGRLDLLTAAARSIGLLGKAK